jgi:hypothetical protein
MKLSPDILVKRLPLVVTALLLALIQQTFEPRVHVQTVVNAAYSFSEATGATAGDSSGNGNTAQVSGATWTSEGKYGSAVSLDGMDDRLQVAAAPTLDLTTAFTVEAWINPTRSGVWQAVVFKDAPSGSGPYSCGYREIDMTADRDVQGLRLESALQACHRVHRGKADARGKVRWKSDGLQPHKGSGARIC